MASVYKAWDTNLERWVAIKIMHDYLAEEKDFRARFEREAKLVASLNHPNIVQVHDFDVLERPTTPLYYMVMAYVEGSSLRSLMEKKRSMSERLTLFEIENVMQGVCSALSYAHQRGMVHRDVTPGNILFNERGQPVLADFGIARIVSGARLTQSGTTSGTPMYMSPEQSIGESGDARSDIYSVGVILYEMLTGEPPYDGDSAFAILLKHANDPIPSPLRKNPGLPRVLESIIFRALAKKPEERYQRIDDLLADLERVILSERTATKLPVPTETLILSASKGKRARLPRRALLVGGVGLVAMIAIGLLLFFASRPPTLVTQNVPVSTATPGVPPLSAGGFAPSMTQGPYLFEDNFGPDRGAIIWPITMNDPNVFRNIENNTYHIWHKLSATAVTTILDPSHQYGAKFIFLAEITINDHSQADTGAGIVFRYQNEDAYYVFAINGQGQVSMWLRYHGTWTELRKLATNWTPAEGANPLGQKNLLCVYDDGAHLQGYVNNKLVIDIQSQPVITSGAVGFYLATTESPIPNPLAEMSVSHFGVKIMETSPADEWPQ
jgi:serine/threonine protein kinase